MVSQSRSLGGNTSTEINNAVKKEGRKTAIRVYDTEAEATAHLGELDAKEKAFIEIRKGEPVRCTGNFCGVAAWCSQYQKELKNDQGI